MITDRITVPNDGEPVLVPVTDTGTHGKSLGLYNLSSEDLELCGSPDDAANSFRGFLAESVIFMDLSSDEPVYVINNGANDAEVDAVGFR